MPGQSAMPAAGRSTAAIHVLTARLEDVPPGADVGPLPGLAQFLAAVPDHRRAQGRRHSLVSVLSLARAAVAAGARSLVAIAEWAADAPGHALDSLGVRRDPCGGALVVPSETTIRRTLCDTDPDTLDEQLAAWAAPAADPAPHDDAMPAAQVSPGQVDGKSLCGAIQPDGRAVHLLAAMSGAGAVLAQREVGHKTNEITQVRPLLDPLCLDGAVITLDALHCQRETARFIVEDNIAAGLRWTGRNYMNPLSLLKLSTCSLPNPCLMTHSQSACSTNNRIHVPGLRNCPFPLRVDGPAAFSWPYT